VTNVHQKISVASVISRAKVLKSHHLNVPRIPIDPFY